MRPPKFNFVPESQLKEGKQDKFFTASIITNGQLCFNSDYTDVYELTDKFAEFYADKEKRSIAWRVIEEQTQLETLNSSRQLKPNQKGVIKISLVNLLHLFGWEKGTSYLKLPVEIYKTGGLEYHYVTLPDVFIK